MGMEVDRQFFDLLTVIDNLMKQNNNLQLQNNALLQRNNAILGAILEKPAVLEAPRLTELVVNQQTISVPENVDIAPQFFVDKDEKRFYVMAGTFYISGWGDLSPNSTSDSGNIKLGDFFKFGLLRLIDFKYVGFNIIEPVTNVPANVSVIFQKNQSNVFRFFILPDESEKIFPDRSDTRYNFKDIDTFREVITNGSSTLSVRIYGEKHFAVYRETNLEIFKDYIDFIKQIV
jgi:hypothetical protein